MSASAGIPERSRVSPGFASAESMVICLWPRCGARVGRRERSHPRTPGCLSMAMLHHDGHAPSHRRRADCLARAPGRGGWLTAAAVALPLPGGGRLREAAPRSRRLGLAAASTGVGKLVGLAVQMVQVPLIVAAVGTDGYGEAVGIVAFLGLLTACDLGFGAAVKNAAADLLGSRAAVGAFSDLLLKAAAWSAVVAATVAGIIVAAPELLAFLPGSDSILPLLGEDAATRWLLAAAVGLGLPLAVAMHCAEGLQLTWLVNVCRMAAAGVGLGVIAMTAAVVSDRWQVVALLSMIPLLAGGFTWLAVSRYLPRASGREAATVPLPRLIGNGLPFALPIVASLLVAHAPQLAILAADGSPAVTRYAVGQRIMAVLIQPLMVAVGPLWPAFAEARATGDRAWVARTMRRAAVAGATYCCGATVVAMAAGRWLAAAWVGRPEAVPTSVEMAAIAAAAGSVALVQPAAMLLNAYRRFRMSTAIAVLQVGLALAYEPLARLAGPAAVPAAQAVFGLVVVVPAVIVESRAALRQ